MVNANMVLFWMIMDVQHVIASNRNKQIEMCVYVKSVIHVNMVNIYYFEINFYYFLGLFNFFFVSGYFTDSEGCETCLCKPKWLSPCGQLDLSCDIKKCEFGTYLDRNGCPSCECLPNPDFKYFLNFLNFNNFDWILLQFN
jgi:hypothetical protein